VPAAAKLIPDTRVRQFWDGDRLLGSAYRRLQFGAETLDLGRDAWDIYFLYGPDAHWTDSGPPRPDWWEHQLWGAPEERFLDPERFATKATELGKQP
jgi:hypothetical protein